MKKTHIFLLLFLLFGSNSLRAQSAPSAAASAIRQIVLGNATVPLDGLWKFHIGDNMAWAQPGFDDSAWDTQDLTPPPGSYDPTIGSSGFVPGWTARGYKGYHGYAWYRLRVNIQSGQTALALKMPEDFDDAYQVYINGRLIGQFGRFTKRSVTYYYNKPRAFPLPTSVLHRNAEANGNVPVTIAIRMWMAASTPLQQQEAGGLHGPPTLGQASVIHALLGMYWYALDRRESSIILSIAINLLVLLVAFGLYWLDRNETAYLWLGLISVVGVLYVIVLLLGGYTTWMNGTAGELLPRAVGEPVAGGLEVLFWAYWFRLDGMARLQRMVWSAVAALGMATAMMLPPLYGSVVAVHAIVWLSPLTVILKLLLGALLVWVTVRGIRKDKTEGWLALPAVLLAAASMYWPELVALHLLAYFVLFGVFFPLGLVSNYVSLAIILVLMLRRFLRTQREREQFRLEMEQARQVQQLLVPATTPNTPGFAVESVYLPASSVGGDFFQILPGGDGSLLIVVGDVSGKGLKAAMLVSSIVGGLKQIATRQPVEVLIALNRQLHTEMAGGFVTCCAALIASDGAMTIANAGHLSPYLNGKEMTVPGGLPLGILAEGSYEETHYQLAPGDRLTFVSDGVVEATNEKKELFGFERTQAISNQPAQTVAEAAKNFGQEDDISVLSVTRNANMQAALA